MTGEETNDEKGPNVWSFLISVSALITVVVVTINVINRFGTSEEVVSVLGAALPVVGVLGGAGVGVAVSWPAAKAKGKAEGRQQGKAEAATAIDKALDSDKIAVVQAGDASPTIVGALRGVASGLRA